MKRVIVVLTCLAVVILSPSYSTARSPDMDGAIRQLLGQKVAVPSDEGSQPVAWPKMPRPAADAPIELHLVYWSHFGQGTVPADLVARLLDGCDRYPLYLPGLVSRLPGSRENVERVRKFYDRFGRGEVESRYSSRWDGVLDWLKAHAQDRRELHDSVRNLRVLEAGEFDRSSFDDLRRLACADPEGTRPFLQQGIASPNPVTATLFAAVLFGQTHEGSLRSRLQAAACDRSVGTFARTIAIDALMQVPWPGRNAWYLGLFSDSSLTDGGALAGPVKRKPEPWMPHLLPFLRGPGGARRENALRCIMETWAGEPPANRHQSPPSAVVVALLPWLRDPGWFPGPGRRSVFAWCGYHRIPQALPLLMKIAEGDTTDSLAAALALGAYRSRLALPALWKAMRKAPYDWLRFDLMEPLIACGGVSDADAARALEALAAQLARPGGGEALYRGEKRRPFPLELGMHFVNRHPVSNRVAEICVQRVKLLASRQPGVSSKLWHLLVHFPCAAVYSQILYEIEGGRADAETIQAAATSRRALVAQALPRIRALADKAGTRRGIAVGLLGDEARVHAICESDDREAMLALLAVARLARQILPWSDTARLLASPDASTVRAARSYLETLDNPKARAVLLERFASEHPVVGTNADLAAFIRAWEDRLRDEVRGPSGPQEIHALLGATYDPHAGSTATQSVLRIWGDHAEYARHPDVCYRWRRASSSEEAAAFAALMRTLSSDDLAAAHAHAYHPSLADLFHVDCKGGHRVTMLNSRGHDPRLWAAVEAHANLLGASPLALRFDIQDRIPGVDILFAEDKRIARGVWARGDDVRVLVEPLDDSPIGRGRRQAPRPEQQYWEALSTPTTQGANRRTTAPPGFPTASAGESSWQAQAQGVRYEAREDGLYAVTGTQSAKRLASGRFSEPVVSDDGHWLTITEGLAQDLISRQLDLFEHARARVVCFDLLTGNRKQVDIATADRVLPVTWSRPLRKFLVVRARHGLLIPDTYGLYGDYDDPKSVGPGTPEFYFYDPANGTVAPFRGEVAPLLAMRRRPLQPTSEADVVWAAVRGESVREGTKVGWFSTRTCWFEPKVTYPSLTFNSGDMWVDESRGRVYVVYDGYVLRLPMSR